MVIQREGKSKSVRPIRTSETMAKALDTTGYKVKRGKNGTLSDAHLRGGMKSVAGVGAHDVKRYQWQSGTSRCWDDGMDGAEQMAQ
jgi:hypothetical protein